MSAKIIYRTAFSFCLVTALLYFFFGLNSLTSGLAQLELPQPSTYIAEMEALNAPQIPPLEVLLEDQFQTRSLAPTSDLDTLWQTGNQIQVIQGFTTATLALITALSAGFALANKKSFAWTTLVLVMLTYLVEEIFSFIRVGMYGLGSQIIFYEYNFYFFNLLEALAILAVVGSGLWVLLRYQPHVNTPRPLPAKKQESFAAAAALPLLLVALIMTSLIFAAYNFGVFKDAATQLTSGQSPSVVITRQLKIAEAEATIGNLPFNQAAMKASFERQLYTPSFRAPNADLDTLWTASMSTRIIGTTIAFIFALTTILLTFKALQGYKTMLFASIAGLFSTFLATELTRFIGTGIYGVGQFEYYRFSFWLLAFVCLLTSCLLVVHFLRPDEK